MWHDYGRKIIKAIFKKRTDSPTICAKLESKVQADSDRSDISLFEFRLSTEQYGDYEQSTGIAAQESESARIVAIAKANGLFIDKSEWYKFGDRKRLPSGESIVFINDKEDVVTIAITDVSANSDNVLFDGQQLYFIDPIIKFNQPATNVLEYYYKLLG